tara:strand:- start:458 stop:610 length:153 start_codon:yes stop_codon:yes gene_type:complete
MRYFAIRPPNRQPTSAETAINLPGVNMYPRAPEEINPIIVDWIKGEDTLL